MVDSSGQVLNRSMVESSGQSNHVVTPNGDICNVIVVSTNKESNIYSPCCYDSNVSLLQGNFNSSIYIDNYNDNACPINITGFKCYL